MDERFVERLLTARTIGGESLLDARVCERSGSRFARLFFRSGTPFEAIAFEDGHAPTARRNFGGAPVFDWAAQKRAGKIPVVVNGERAEVEPLPAETHLFEGLNTCIAFRNGETAETALEWLRFHVGHHGMQGALVLDRAAPGKDAGYFAELASEAAGIAGLERLVYLRASVPLGAPSLPPEAHPYNAPGAPGKDRMELPPADPWASPLAEWLIFEVLRAWFLDEARAVASLELCDLLAPGAEKTVFDRAVAAPGGCVRLEGRQVYPWRVRKSAAARFGDHICVQFDQPGARRRWCVCPPKTPDNAIWRLVRVVGLKQEIEETAGFYRFMALRHPTESVSRIVPKTGLIEDDALLDLSQRVFGANPVRMPGAALVRPEGKPQSTTIVTTMKNEGPFILEWLAYHRAIGVDNFLVYTNDCDDGTDSMLRLLQDKGLVQHRENPFRESGLKPQHAALQAAETEPVIQQAEWLVCMDVDEFINVKCGEGRLSDLYAAVPDANMISMTWRLFGNSDIHEFRDVPMIETFVRCAPELIRKPHQAWGFKTLFRNIGIFKKLGVHRPKGLRPQLWEDINWVNGSGEPMPQDMYRNGWRSTMQTYGYDLVQLNHYAVRSAESFLVKRDRGRVNHVDRDQGLSYWFRMNNNAVEERSIGKRVPMMRAELSRLMADPEIATAHEFSVRKHREKIEELHKRPDFAELYQALTGRRLERLSRLHSHFGANVFLGGPDVIPDEIAEKEPGDDFWFTVKRGETTH